MIIWLIGLGAGLGVWVVVPQTWLAVLGVNAALCLAARAIQLVATLRPPAKLPLPADLPPSPARRKTFVSIHVPTHDEPSGIVIGTLQALARLDHAAFEVVVLDNNTPDPAVWQPVAAACERLGPRFRFFHRDGVAGAKAGALTLCRAAMNPAATHIAVVDADYAVTPDFLTLALDRMVAHDAAFVQFPQAFRGAGADAVAHELGDYFAAYARRANDTRSMLPTGTLSVIAVDALDRAGGWSAATPTEDAELGMRLFAQEARGVYVDHVVGRGVMPVTLDGLKTQRRRWVAGNVQTLVTAVRRGLLGPHRPGSLGVVAQLCAWPAFWLAPAVVLVAGAILPQRGAVPEACLSLAALTLIASALLVMDRVLISALLRGETLRAGILALVVKAALVWTSSWAWIEGLLRQSFPFVRTQKRVGRESHRSLLPELLAGLGGGGATVIHLMHGRPMLATASALVAATLPAALWVSFSLRRYGASLHNANDAGEDLPSEEEAPPCIA